MKIIGEMDIFLKHRVIWTFMTCSIIVSLVLLAVSNPTVPSVHGQIDLVSLDSANSNNSDSLDEPGSPLLHREH